MPLVGQSFHKNNLSSSSASSSSSSTRVALFTTAFKQNSLQSWSIFRNFNWCTKTKIATIKLNNWLENLIPILTKRIFLVKKKKNLNIIIQLLKFEFELTLSNYEFLDNIYLKRIFSVLNKQMNSIIKFNLFKSTQIPSFKWNR